MSQEIAIQIKGLKKQYRLGQIGGGTLTADLQSWWARVRGKEDPNSKIGSDQRLIGQTFMALNGIDLTVRKGEALGIIGSNGAGKSTMLKILSRITAPTEGTVDIYGRIASMLEVGTGFSPEMTGRENIYMNGAILGMTRAEIDAKIEDIIEFSEVREFIDTPVKRYSSGMYVKLAFSVAAHLDADILVMDEVLAVGDMKFQQKCLGKMGDVAHEGRTVLYVSHNMNTIRQLCTRCIVLDQGRIIFDGDVEEAIAIYLGCNTKGQLRYVYDAKYHTCKKSVRDFAIEGMEILNRDSPVYSAGEKIELTLKCRAQSRRANVKFRFEWRYRDGHPIGAMMSRQTVDLGDQQDNDIQIQVDLSHFTPGRYSADIIAYRQNEFGTEEFLDGVYPGIEIDITESVVNGDNINWYHGPWGHIRLHDLDIGC